MQPQLATMETVVIGVCDFTDLEITVTHPYSVLTTDGSIIIAPSTGESSLQHDGGQNFDLRVFMNLPVGEYNIVVTDTSALAVTNSNGCSFLVALWPSTSKHPLGPLSGFTPIPPTTNSASSWNHRAH